MFETQRLLIRQYTLDDAKSYFALKSCELVWKYSTFIPFREFKQAEDELHQIVTTKSIDWFDFLPVFEKETNSYIGEAGIISCNRNANRCEIGYNILPEYWGKGYATELTRFFVKYAFEFLKFERVEALVIQENVASCRVLEKSGFLLEGVLRNFSKSGNGYRNVCYYSIITSDYSK